MDPIFKKAMEKRDKALRELERWELWIKAYTELSGPAIESLDIWMNPLCMRENGRRLSRS